MVTQVIRLTAQLVCIVMLFTAMSSIGHAEDVQALDSIQAAATEAVESQLPATTGKYFVTATRLDPRLRLAACSTALEASLQGPVTASAKVAVGVHCPSESQWTVYVPVSIEHEAQVFVLRRGLARRARVEALDVELQTRRMPGIASNLISDLGVLEGRRLKRALPAGAALTADVFAIEVLVKRGQHVTLLAANGAIEIRAAGQAMSEGGASDRIRVQNINSMKIVEGVIENAGLVRVAL